MNSGKWRAFVEGLVGLSVGIVLGVIAIATNLLIFNGYTRTFIAEGGFFGAVFGISIGLWLGRYAVSNTRGIVAAAVILALGAIAGVFCANKFNGIVALNSAYSGVDLHLAFLAFGVFLPLFLLTTICATLMELAFGEKTSGGGSGASPSP